MRVIVRQMSPSSLRQIICGLAADGGTDDDVTVANRQRYWNSCARKSCRHWAGMRPCDVTFSVVFVLTLCATHVTSAPTITGEDIPLLAYEYLYLFS